MTTYIAESPRRRTMCGTDWAQARDTLADDALHLAKANKVGYGDVEQAKFREIAAQIRSWDTPGVPMHLTFFDAWGSPRRFQIVAQEELEWP